MKIQPATPHTEDALSTAATVDSVTGLTGGDTERSLAQHAGDRGKRNTKDDANDSTGEHTQEHAGTRRHGRC